MKCAGAILAIAVCLPAFVSAEERCPWLNVATAGGFLGGDVHVTVTSSSCEFVRPYEGFRAVLLIEVRPAGAPHTQCGSGAVPLKAIGNEAQACDYQAAKGWMGEQVVGRVRDQAFLVRISTDDRSASPKVLREKTRDVAEQVAGILF